GGRAALAGVHAAARGTEGGRRDRGRRRAVVGLVHAGGAADQRGRGDVRGGGGAGRGELIVARGVAAQAQARGGNALASAGVLVGECRRAADQADVLAAHHAAEGAGRDRGRCRAVVGLVVGGDAAR